MTAHWYVARCKTGREVVASVNVAEMGYPTFLPMMLVKRSHAGQVQQVNRPLFPRYLFVRFDAMSAGFGRINNCRGVANRGLIVNVDGIPKHIPDVVIDRIRGRETIMRAKAGEVTTGYQPGDTFKIPIGIFASMTATYVGEERGIVFATVEVFGRGHLQEFAFEDVPQNPKTLDSLCA